MTAAGIGWRRKNSSLIPPEMSDKVTRLRSMLGHPGQPAAGLRLRRRPSTAPASRRLRSGCLSAAAPAIAGSAQSGLSTLRLRSPRSLRPGCLSAAAPAIAGARNLVDNGPTGRYTLSAEAGDDPLRGFLPQDRAEARRPLPGHRAAFARRRGPLRVQAALRPR